MSATIAVPRRLKLSMAGSLPSLAPYSRTAPITFCRSWNGGILWVSTTMALIFFEPSTAPTPPRAASRDGRPSVSANEIPAISPRYSPTGPHSAKLIFLPYFSNSMRATSLLPLPM